MDTQDLIRKVRKIEIKTRGLTHQLFSGAYRSASKGRGMSFREVRNYQYGDDVRNIDWNVTARYNEPFVKVFEEERERIFMLLVDVSRSSCFGTRGQLKHELMTELSAVLAFAAIRNNDKVGILFFTDRVEHYVPPQKGKNQVLRIIRDLLCIEPSGTGTDLSVALHYLANVQKKGSTVFLLSDFMVAKSYEDALRIASRRHDVVGMRLYDTREYDLPDVGLVRLQDLETGEQRWVDTSRALERERYRAGYEAYVATFEETFRRLGLDHLPLRTDESYLGVLRQFFGGRR